MELRIRPASPHDAEALRGVHASSWLAAFRGLVPEAALLERVAGREAGWYREMIDRPGTRRAGTWVGEPEGAVAGFGHFREGADPDVGEISLFYLRPEWWGRGVARPLLDGVLDDMRVLDFRLASIPIFAGNPRARRFFERAGFRPGDEVDLRPYGDRELAVVTYRLVL